MRKKEKFPFFRKQKKTKTKKNKIQLKKIKKTYNKKKR